MAPNLRATLAAAVVAVGALGLTGPAQAAGPPSHPSASWPRGLTDPFSRSAPVIGRSGELNGVYCTSAADCWAVGDRDANSGRLNQVLHWTGRQWFKVAVPEPAGTGTDDENELSAVRCTSASDCWAVGDYRKRNAADLNQILHWTGKKWFAVTAPTPAGTLPGDRNVLIDVACTSAAACWAVGDYGTGDTAFRNQALRWNGKTWSLVPTPNPAGSKKNHVSALSGVRCTSPDDCWAAGAYGVIDLKPNVRNEMLHWTGRKWTQVLVPSPVGTPKHRFNELFSLSCTSARNCLVVGFTEKFDPSVAVRNEILRWNGTKWAEVHVPNPAGTGSGAINELTGVTCASARDCWAVGTYGDATSAVERNQTMHWNGTVWKAITAPNPAGTGKDDFNRLTSVRCPSPASCWTVGSQGGHIAPKRDEALHWNGTKWAVS
jgi:hypothetical protein